MTNGEETETKGTSKEPVEIKPDPELIEKCYFEKERKGDWRKKYIGIHRIYYPEKKWAIYIFIHWNNHEKDGKAIKSFMYGG